MIQCHLIARDIDGSCEIVLLVVEARAELCRSPIYVIPEHVHIGFMGEHE